MSVSTSAEPRTAPRPGSVRALIGTLGFLGLTALGGGIEMLLFPRGNEFLPAEFLDRIPVADTFVLPGLVLAGMFGVGSLVVLVGVLRRPRSAWLGWVERRTGRHWSWAATLALGLGFLAWMAIEITWLGTPWESPPGEERTFAFVLYGIYLTVAGLLTTLPWAGGVQRYLGVHTPGR